MDSYTPAALPPAITARLFDGTPQQPGAVQQAEAQALQAWLSYVGCKAAAEAIAAERKRLLPE